MANTQTRTVNEKQTRTKHPHGGYISHAKSAENTDSFLSLTPNSPNTQIFLMARVDSRWRWNLQNGTSFTVLIRSPLTAHPLTRSPFIVHRSPLFAHLLTFINKRDNVVFFNTNCVLYVVKNT